MEVVHVTEKGKMDTLEGFHIYKETKAGNQINDRLTFRENAILETIIQEDPYRRRAASTQPNSYKYINDRLTFRENAILETIIQEDPYRRRAASTQPNSCKNSCE